MILPFINIRKVPRKMLKTSGFANVNEWKTMFDPYIEKCSIRKLLLWVGEGQNVPCTPTRFSQNVYDNNGKYLTLGNHLSIHTELTVFELRVCKDKLTLRVMASFHSIEHLTL